MKTLLEFDEIIFASPIYWYAPSAQMKVLLDRITDLLDDHKGVGRRLRGKRAGILATGATDDVPTCFVEMWVKTFEYLGMHYTSMLYSDCTEGYLAQQKSNIGRQASAYLNRDVDIAKQAVVTA